MGNETLEKNSTTSDRGNKDNETHTQVFKNAEKPSLVNNKRFQ